jgi:hypothetical protein
MIAPCRSCNHPDPNAHAPYCPLAVTCPVCHQGDRRWCKRPSGHKAMTLHKPRIELAERGSPWAPQSLDDEPQGGLL